MGRSSYFVVLLLLVTCLIGSSRSTLTDTDREQQRINEEAYQHRFDREPVADEETGIIVSDREEFPTRPRFEKPDLKMVLMTGDDSITAFDNARKKTPRDVHKRTGDL